MILLQFSPAAKDDLEAIADYIAEDSPATSAIRFIDQLRVQCLRLVKAPMAYASAPKVAIQAFSNAASLEVSGFSEAARSMESAGSTN